MPCDSRTTISVELGKLQKELTFNALRTDADWSGVKISGNTIRAFHKNIAVDVDFTADIPVVSLTGYSGSITNRAAQEAKAAIKRAVAARIVKDTAQKVGWNIKSDTQVGLKRVLVVGSKR